MMNTPQLEALTLSSGIPPVTRVGEFESGLRWGRASRN
jgi:hypothetical protein